MPSDSGFPKPPSSLVEGLLPLQSRGPPRDALAAAGTWAVLGACPFAVTRCQDFPPGGQACRKPAGSGRRLPLAVSSETQGGLDFTSPPPSSSSSAPGLARPWGSDFLISILADTLILSV